jgi:hypothetical protein
MAVIQEYQVQVVTGANQKPPIRDVYNNITIRLKDTFRYLQPCLQVINTLVPSYDYTGWNEYSRNDHSNFIDFDFEVAKNIARPNRLHITEAFGVIHGTVLNALGFGMFPQNQPILAQLMLPKKIDSVITGLIIEWDEEVNKKFKGYINNNYPEIEIVSIKDISYPIDTVFSYINSFDFIIGKASTETYIAAALDKCVVEIFESEEDQYLYINNNIEVYASTVGKPTLDYLWFMWETAWETLKERLQNMKCQDETHKVLQESTVDVVSEK